MGKYIEVPRKEKKNRKERERLRIERYRQALKGNHAMICPSCVFFFRCLQNFLNNDSLSNLINLDHTVKFNNP